MEWRPQQSTRGGSCSGVLRLVILGTLLQRVRDIPDPDALLRGGAGKDNFSKLIFHLTDIQVLVQAQLYCKLLCNLEIR